MHLLVARGYLGHVLGLQRRLLRYERQLEHERRPLARERLDMQPAAVGLGEATRDRQSQAGTTMSSLRRAGAIEGFEHALQLCWGDAGAAVDDANHEPVAGWAPTRAFQRSKTRVERGARALLIRDQVRRGRLGARLRTARALTDTG